MFVIAFYYRLKILYSSNRILWNPLWGYSLVLCLTHDGSSSIYRINECALQSFFCGNKAWANFRGKTAIMLKNWAETSFSSPCVSEEDFFLWGRYLASSVVAAVAWRTPRSRNPLLSHAPVRPIRARWSEHRSWGSRHTFWKIPFSIARDPRTTEHDSVRAQGKWGLLWFLLFLWKDRLILSLGFPWAWAASLMPLLCSLGSFLRARMTP